MMMDDYDGQMIFGDLVGLKLPDISLTGEEKPQKNLTQETCPDRGSNLGQLHDRHACYLTIVVSTYPLQQQFNIATTKLVTHTLYLMSVESLVQNPELVQVELRQCPQGLIQQRLHMAPQKKSSGIKSGDHGGHIIGLPRPIHLCLEHQ